MRQVGFTLTETLIAVALLASLSAGLLLTVRTIIDADAGVRRVVAGEESRALANESIRDVLRYGYRPPRADTGSRFEGGAGGFRLLVHPPGSPNASLANVSLDGTAVSISLTPLDVPRSRAVSALLYSGFSQAEIRYFGRDEDGVMLWSREWARNWAPTLVSIEIQEENGQVWRIEALVEGQGGFDCPLDRDAGTCLEP